MGDGNPLCRGLGDDGNPAAPGRGEGGKGEVACGGGDTYIDPEATCGDALAELSGGARGLTGVLEGK